MGLIRLIYFFMVFLYYALRVQENTMLMHMCVNPSGCCIVISLISSRRNLLGTSNVAVTSLSLSSHIPNVPISNLVPATGPLYWILWSSSVHPELSSVCSHCRSNSLLTRHPTVGRCAVLYSPIFFERWTTEDISLQALMVGLSAYSYCDVA
jgi:hypothetical protein